MPRKFNDDDDFVQLCTKIYHTIKDLRQRNMAIPTDPKEIHRRANLIRERIEAEKETQRELDQIKKDLDLIRFDHNIRAAQPKKEAIAIKGIKYLVKKLSDNET